MKKILIVDGSLAKSHVGSYTRKDGTFVKEHEDGRTAAAPAMAKPRAKAKPKAPAFDHPNVVGHAADHKVLSGSSEVAGNGDLTDKGSTSMKFGGKTYHQTGKTGKSAHDGTPVTAYEHEESGHRVWGDAKGRVHADSTDEVGKLRAAGAKSGGAGSDAKGGIDKHLSNMKPGESKTFANGKGRFPQEKATVSKTESGYTIKSPFGSSDHDHSSAVDKLHRAFEGDGMKEVPSSASKADAKAKSSVPGPVKSKNEGNGFHGEASNAHLRKKYGPDDYYDKASQSDNKEAAEHASRHFADAAHKLVEGGHFESHDKAGEYLDSRHGRHLHDAASAHGGDVSKVPWLSKDVARFKKTGGKPF